MKQSILVWDLPTRCFHWSLALCFAGAYLSAESERWRNVHVVLGYTLLGLIVFRLVWGLIGTRYARFAEFVRGPAAIRRYLTSAVQGKANHTIGHNPAGAWAILALLGLGMASALSGWAVDSEMGGDWVEELHEWTSNVMLGIVLLHIAGVLISSRLHKENLTRAMVTGRKWGEPSQAIAGARPLVAALLMFAIAAFWIWSFQEGTTTPASTLSRQNQELEDDD